MRFTCFSLVWQAAIINFVTMLIETPMTRPVARMAMPSTRISRICALPCGQACSYTCHGNGKLNFMHLIQYNQV